ncbi:MAG: hypothetical protein KGS72_28995 [Cyanobacteria bacterium REEB67]|nr:hypothetical protein [Cyanobacteria bacterium REEB67]
MSIFYDTGKETEPDDRNRVSLGAAVKTPEGVRYKVKQNDQGQILLDPVKLVPAYEAWFHANPERVAEFKLAVAQAEAGQLVSIDLGPDQDEDEDE